MKLSSIQSFLRNKKYQRIILLVFIILVISLLPLSRSRKTPTPTDTNKINEKSVTEKEKQTSIEEKAKLTTLELPLIIRDVPTSSGITTTVVITSLEHEPDYSVRVDIEPINFDSYSVSSNNPDYIAFTETLTRIKQELLNKSIDPEKLIYTFSFRPQHENIAQTWAESINWPK